MTTAHRGLDHKGVERDCVQEIHFCIDDYGPPIAPYEAFLESKRIADAPSGFTIDHDRLNDQLFGFQRDIVTWALGRGRAAIFADCGLGKTPMQLEWARHVHEHTGRDVLILAPLAVAEQTVREGEKFGVTVTHCRNGDDVRPGVNIANYERLHLFDATAFGGIVLDESSILKNFDGTRRAQITEFMRRIQYHLLCTATAAPNDYTELGTSSEALGELGYMDMLARFFKNDQHTSSPMKRGIRRNDAGWHYSAQWRLKGHAEDAFWRWVTSWARAIRKPSDLGYQDEGFSLPPLNHRQHIVKASRPKDGMLFEVPAVGLAEEREELRRTIDERCRMAADLLADVDRGVAWCNLNDEAALLVKYIDGAVQVSGSDSDEEKERKLTAFTRGEIRVMVTKPVIGAWGLNWQHCHHMTFFPTHSYEQYYQAVRRCWRFGQLDPVTVDIVTTEGGARTLENLEHKSAQASRMFDSLTEHMRNALSVARSDEYNLNVEVPSWVKS